MRAGLRLCDPTWRLHNGIGEWGLLWSAASLTFARKLSVTSPCGCQIFKANRQVRRIAPLNR
jgi:hypothetical protein